MRLMLLALLAGSAGWAQGLIGEMVLGPEAISRRVEAGGLFRGLGLVSEDTVAARLRGSRDGVVWGEWRDVELGHEGGTLVWFDEGIRFVEVLAVAQVRMLFIEPGYAKAGLESRRGAAGEPSVVTRAGWGCGAECVPRAAPVYANVSHLVVHHSAGANASSDWPAVIRSIWVLHVKGNGWNDIGYNFLVDPNGIVYEGRAGGDGVIGAHFSGVNTRTMGVCMVGTFTTRGPSGMAIESLKKVLGWQAEKWKLDPTGQTRHAASGLTLNVISGHRDAGLSPQASGTTECPGLVLYTYLPGLRGEVNGAVGCSIQLRRRNYCFGSEATGLPVEFENPRSCDVGVEGGADWVSVAEGRLNVTANLTASRRSVDLKIGGQILQVVQAESGVVELPCVSRGSVVNGASFDERPLARGTIASLFGTGLEGARVLVNGSTTAATVFASTANQVNFALPTSVQPGSARLVVERNGVRSSETMFWVTETAPAVFADASGRAFAQFTEDRKIVVVYVTGLGTDRTLAWEATIGGRRAQGLYLGATPGFIGLGQANLGLPDGLIGDEWPLEISVSGVASPTLRLVRP